ncbi:M15 family metallopeptidase [Providencia rettgeri]|uniref:M15 family metallopeptidase n=1 Tax=Providencia rettgeri TaxID=587 RepID=UPI001CFDC917|nr:M15 family metallopeptidase [Providencia rettgeri]MCB4853495.1 M15 family metallopeptidase [Providencia rettgeri]MCD6314062.1 M15 family metallopeptidase [Providencia rettgeri]
MKKPFVFSQRSKNNLVGVDPRLVKVIIRALELTSADFAVIEGVRSQAKQAEYVNNGASQTSNSRHLTGHAVDVLPSAMKPGMDWNEHADLFEPILLAIKQAGDELGVPLRFGKNWTHDPSLPVKTNFPDYPHVEIPR